MQDQARETVPDTGRSRANVWGRRPALKSEWAGLRTPVAGKAAVAEVAGRKRSKNEADWRGSAGDAPPPAKDKIFDFQTSE